MRWLLTLMICLIAPPWSGPARLPLLGRDAVITVERVLLDPKDAGRTRVGALRFLGGVRLSSPDSVFGGFSAIAVAGDDFLLLSDGGNIVRFGMGADWQPRDVRFANLIPGPRIGWEKCDRDSESLVIDPATDTAWVGFENVNEIWAYDSALGKVRRRSAPRAMRGWGENGGAETMVRLADGRFIVIAETERARGGPERAAILFAGDPAREGTRAFRFAYRPPAQSSPSDAAVLPDGRIIIINRRFAAPLRFSAVLTLVDPDGIRPGATVRGREIATFAPPLIHDNFEGIAVTQEGARTIIWLVSDDNQLAAYGLQSTYLLKFALDRK